MQKNIILVLFFYSCLIYSQKTIELSTFDCNKGEYSINEIQRTKFTILTEHEIISDTTSKYWYEFKFKTKSDNVRIKYENIYKQEIDTTFILQKNNEKLFLCVDTFKDYKTKSLIRKAIMNKEKWNLKKTEVGCYGIFNSELIIVPRKKKLVVKYTYWNYPENSNKIKKYKIRKIITEDQVKFIESFEKKLRLMNRPNGQCTAQDYYDLKVGMDELNIEESSCSGFDENELLNNLGIK